MDSGLAGRTALVTGASGGIGWAVARALAAEGCRLALQARTGVKALRDRLGDAGLDGQALVLEADVRDPAAVADLFEHAADHFGSVELCVASAGIWPPEAQRLDELAPERAREVLEINLLGALWTARSFLSQVAGRCVAGSSLVLIGSTAGRFGEAGHADYATSKAGLRGLMLSYKNEVVLVDPAGRCNLVEPGWTATPMTTESLAEDALVRHVTRTMALRRIATVEDIAAAVVYFCSPRLAAHATGQTLTLAGGMEGRLLWDEDDIDPNLIRQALGTPGDPASHS
jgi:3-oxoacyl-[acyl-carrier protein] reductase